MGIANMVVLAIVLGCLVETECLFFSGKGSSGDNGETTEKGGAAPAKKGRDKFKTLKCSLSNGSSRNEKNSSAANSEAPVFYIPEKDRELYEKGIRNVLSQLQQDPKSTKGRGNLGLKNGNQEELSLTLKCENVAATELTSTDCQLCIYNEVSTDKRHLRQGQIVDITLDNCIGGRYSAEDSKMLRSQYHPICFPPEISQASRNGAKGKTVPVISKSNSFAINGGTPISEAVNQEMIFRNVERVFTAFVQDALTRHMLVEGNEQKAEKKQTNTLAQDIGTFVDGLQQPDVDYLKTPPTKRNTRGKTKVTYQPLVPNDLFVNSFAL